MINTAKEREKLALIAITEFEGTFCSCSGYREHEDTCDFIMVRDTFHTLAAALDEIDRLRATLSAITATDCYSRDECTDMARAALRGKNMEND